MEILACTTSESHENRTLVNCAMFEAATSHSIGSKKESYMLCKKWRAARSVPNLPHLPYCRIAKTLGSVNCHSTQAAITHQIASTATDCETIDLRILLFNFYHVRIDTSSSKIPSYWGRRNGMIILEERGEISHSRLLRLTHIISIV
jgi:hypothetical protein